MLDTDELLGRLESRGVRNIDIARALGLPDSRVPEIRRKERALKLDEAVKLVRAFGLESDRTPDPPPTPILRLAVRYVAGELGVHPSEEQVEELAQDVRAFAEFVADPKVRRSVDAAEGFFRAMRLRRPAALKAVPQESDHADQR
jgi:hypothetical protein